jgi:anthranilate phosphoribosyltransferase
VKIVEAIARLAGRNDLSRAETADVMTQIMSGEATDAQIAGFLIGLKVKGESVEEVAGAADVMRKKATRVPTNHKVVVDTCGTGGDRSGSFNISTTTAFVVAGAGLPVAKHGNRSITSKCGSADLLAGLGVRIDLAPERVGACLDEVGIGFLFAPLLHSAMKYAIDVRKQLAPTPTVFNMLGPLTNPAGASRQVIGVFRPEMVKLVAETLLLLGTEHAFVVHGHDGLDEITTSDATSVSEVRQGSIMLSEIVPEDIGLPRATADEIRGGDITTNVAITRAVLGGERGAHRDIVLLNAAAALVAGGTARDLMEGRQEAEASIDSGAALRTLDALVRFSNA